MTRIGIFSTTALAGLTCLWLRPTAAQPTTTSRTTTGATSYDTTNDTTTTINHSDTSSRRTLPRTASDVPTIALLGLAAVGGALALRKRSDTA